MYDKMQANTSHTQKKWPKMKNLQNQPEKSNSNIRMHSTPKVANMFQICLNLNTKRIYNKLLRFYGPSFQQMKESSVYTVYTIHSSFLRHNDDAFDVVFAWHYYFNMCVCVCVCVMSRCLQMKMNQIAKPVCTQYLFFLLNTREKCINV